MPRRCQTRPPSNAGSGPMIRSCRRKSSSSRRRSRLPRRSRRRAGSVAAVTYLEAIRDAMAEEMVRDERVFLIGEDIGRFGGAFKVTDGLLDRFGGARVVDTPISES